MGLNIGKIASTVSTIGSVADIASKIGGIDLKSINPSNIGSIKGTIESAINGSSSNIMSQLQSSISVGDIESMGKDIDIEGKAKELQSTIDTSSLDLSNVDSITSDIESQLGSMNLSKIKFM